MRFVSPQGGYSFRGFGDGFDSCFWCQHPVAVPGVRLSPATGIDLHFLPMAENKGSHQCLHWWQELSTGQFLCYGFDSGRKQNTPAPDRGRGILVPATGIEPVRILLRGILSPLCLPIPPQRHFQCICNLTIFFCSSQGKQIRKTFLIFPVISHKKHFLKNFFSADTWKNKK